MGEARYYLVMTTSLKALKIQALRLIRIILVTLNRVLFPIGVALSKKFTFFKIFFIFLLTNQFFCDIILSVVEMVCRAYQFITHYGSIAQLGEHLPYKQRVIGSSPIVPTMMAR